MADAPDSGAPIGSSELVESLDRTLSEFFETMLGEARCAVSAAEDDEAATLACVEVEARVELTGEALYGLRVATSWSVARAVAAGLLMESDPSGLQPEEVRDALGELANMLAGGLKTKLFDERGTWRLGTPQVAEVAPLNASPQSSWAEACPRHRESFAGGELCIQVLWSNAGAERLAA